MAVMIPSDDEKARIEHLWRLSVQQAREKNLWLWNSESDLWFTPEEALRLLDQGEMPLEPRQWEAADPLKRQEELRNARNSITAKLATMTSRYSEWVAAQAEREAEDRGSAED